MDPLSGMGSLNLGGTATSHTQSMQGFPTSLSSAFSNPQSPAKAFPPLSTPNPSTPFGGIGSLSSQLPGMDSGTKLFLLFHFNKHKQARHRFILGIFRWTKLRGLNIVAQRVRWHALKWLCCVLLVAGPLGSGIGSGIGSGLGMQTVNTDPFGTRKMSTPGLNPPTFQQSKMKACKWWL